MTNYRYEERVTILNKRARDKNLTVLSKLKNARTKVKFKCNVCGTEFSKVPQLINDQDYPCPQCVKNHEKHNAKTKDEINAILAQNRPSFRVVGKSNGMSYPAEILHEVCGNVITVIPRNLLRYPKDDNLHGCQHCTHTKEYSSEQIRDVFDKNPNYILVSHFRMGKSNTYTEQLFYSFIRGARCHFCSKSVLKTPEQFKKEVLEQGLGDYSVITDYKNSHDKVMLKHNICNGIYEVEPTSFLMGTRCPYCKSSHGEELVRSELKNLGAVFEEQKSFPGCRYKQSLKFDFYLPNVNSAIEWDGRQHFEPVDYFGGKSALAINKKRDSIKNTFCLRNNIRLYRLPYTLRKEDAIAIIANISKGIMCQQYLVK